MTTKSGISVTVRLSRWPTLALACLLVFAGLALGASSTRAQAQIDQVVPGAAEIEDATQGPVAVTLPGGACMPPGASCGTVTRSDVTGLIPKTTPSLPSNELGNSAVIVQGGSDQHATVEQTGVGNEASITQMNGNGNEATVEQGPGDGLPGTSNLAVIVQKGSMNRTVIRQFGQHNRAGVRLVGNDNGITLEQTGTGNEYLLDFTGSGLGSMGPSPTHQVRQIGRNNRLVQVGEGRMPFNVRQRGDGMRMMIRHDRN